MLQNLIKAATLAIVISNCIGISTVHAMEKRSREIETFSRNDDIVGYRVAEADGQVEAQYNKKTKKYKSTKTIVESALGVLTHHMTAQQAKKKYLALKKAHKKQQTEKSKLNK